MRAKIKPEVSRSDSWAETWLRVGVNTFTPSQEKVLHEILSAMRDIEEAKRRFSGLADEMDSWRIEIFEGLYSLNKDISEAQNLMIKGVSSLKNALDIAPYIFDVTAKRNLVEDLLTFQEDL